MSGNLEKKIDAKVFTLVASNFPEDLLKEWDEDCKIYYKNTRWIKIYSDHLRAKQAGKWENLCDRVSDLEAKLASMEQNKAPKDAVKTMGDNGLR